jgi:hypothetical protein
MGRARASLTALGLVLVVSACGTTGAPDAPGSGTTTASATPSAAGYPLPKGQRIQVSQGQTGSVSLAVGDLLAVHRPVMGTRPSGASLVLAEVTDTQLIYQAVAAGKATLATDDAPTPVCKTTPCPPSGAAPPVLTVDVTK